MTEKNFFKINILVIISILISIMFIVVLIDPYFHYHKPLPFLNYKISNQRYINDGIIKHFDYNAIITGTSMTENFRTSQFDKIFNSNSIKVPFSGGSYREINDAIETALKNNNDIKYVFRGLDYGKINEEYDKMAYDSYPVYLYDNNIFNDYKYWWNKEILIRGIAQNIVYNILGKKTTSFDDYSSWHEETGGKDKVLKNHKRLNKENSKKFLSEEDVLRIDKNISENITKLPKEYPNVKFIYFITPYSIVYWDELNQKNELEKQIRAEEYMLEKILEVSNIELYSFYSNYGLITDLKKYKDPGHYIGEINDQILNWIKNGEYRLSKENYKEYIKKNLEFYQKFDYNKIYEE